MPVRLPCTVTGSPACLARCRARQASPAVAGKHICSAQPMPPDSSVRYSSDTGRNATSPSVRYCFFSMYSFPPAYRLGRKVPVFIMPLGSKASFSVYII